MPEFASLGYLYALDGTPLLEDNEFLETPLSSNVYDGKTYGVPQVTDTLGLMYNKQLFEKAGITEPPTTWDEVADAAQALKQKAGVDGIYINSGGYFLLPFMYGEGGDLVDVDAEEITVNSAENVAGIADRPGPRQERRRRQAGRQRLLRHDDDPLQGGQGRHDHQRPVGGREHLGRPEVRRLREPRRRAGAGRLGRAGCARRWPQLRHLLRHGRVEGRRGDRVRRTSWPRRSRRRSSPTSWGCCPATRRRTTELGDNEKIAAWQSALEVATPRPWIPEGGLFFGPLDEMATKVLIQGEDVQASLDQTAKQYKSDVVPEYSGG